MAITVAKKTNSRLGDAHVGKNALPFVTQPGTLGKPGAYGAKKDIALLLILGATLGALFFVAIFGIAILNPTYVAWVETNGGDLQQHYTGWAMFRQTGWAFPLGITDKLTYPYSISIAYTDSIPLFAVFFKLLSPILPASFQYFGLWGLFCYMATGMAGAVLVRSFSPCKVYCMAGAGFFCASSTIVHRMYMHSALAGQWTILFALVLWAYGGHLGSLKRNLVCWCGLLFVTSWVHPYFVPMVCGILLAYLIHSYTANRGLAAHLIVLVAPILSALLAMWLIGSFSAGGGSLQNAGLGLFSFNLNGFFNPMFEQYSRFLSPLPRNDLQYEGFAYMGLGFLLLLAIVGLLFVWRFTRGVRRCGFAATLRNAPLGAILLLCLGGIFGILALSPVVTANRVTLLTIPYPGFVLDILSIFRCTGRFIWVSLYILLLGGLWLLARWAPKRLAAGALCVLLCLQVADLSTLYAWRRGIVYNGEGELPLHSAAWQELTETRDHLVLEALDDSHYTTYIQLGTLAARGGATLSNFYLARNLPEADATIQEYYPLAIAGALPDTTAVVLFNKNNAAILRWQNSGGTYFYEADGLIIATGTPLPGAGDALPAIDGPLDVLESLPHDLYLAEEAGDGGIIIQPHGDVRGQRTYLPAGSYIATFTGSGLAEEMARPHSEAWGRDAVPYEIIGASTEEIALRFVLEDDLYDFELWLENPSEENIMLTAITLQNG